MKVAVALLCLMAVVAVNAAIPSKFAKTGGPKDAHGTWVTSDGDSVFIQSKDGYQSAYTAAEVDFGKYLSYECTGKGTYKAIVVTEVISRNGTFSGKLEEKYCEIGKVDLEGGTYRYAVGKTKCPTEYTSKAIRMGPWGSRCSYSCT